MSVQAGISTNVHFQEKTIAYIKRQNQERSEKTMKKVYEEPELKVIEIEDTDVICTSGCAVQCRQFGNESATEPVT